MVARHQHHERLLGHHPVFQIEVRFDTEKRHVEPATSERIGEVGGIVAEIVTSTWCNSSRRTCMASDSQFISCPVWKPMAKVFLAGCAARRAASPAASTCASASRA